MKNIISKLSPANIFSRRIKKIDIKTQDIDNLTSITTLLEGISKSQLVHPHPLHDFAKLVRNDISYSNGTLETKLKDAEFLIENSFAHYKNSISTLNNENIGSIEVERKVDVETGLKLIYCQYYFSRLRKAIEDGDVKQNNQNIYSTASLLDAIILGNSSERISEHLRLFSPKVTQGQLQDCFYILLEPEISLATIVCQSIKGLHKHHKKSIPKYAKFYLLDKLELNAKSRCTFCWSDPTYSGFTAPKDDVTMEIPTIINGRKKFFKECETVAYEFLKSYTGERRIYYHDKEENRQTLRNGFIFFLGTCLLDFILISL